MIYEWKLDGVTRNFGDALYEVLLDPQVHYKWSQDQTSMHFPIGSVICNTVIEEALNQGLTPYFHGCGWRGEELEPELVKLCEFDGVRGPHTSAELKRHGIDADVVLDPAYKLPGMFLRGEPNGLAIAVRHIEDDSDYNPDSIHGLKADALFSPVVQDESDIISFIEKVSGARFVLAGSMHAAIVAHAYGVPFALLGGEYVNCPPKWFDWLHSVGITDVQWVDNVRDGRFWYNSAVKK
jgi:hypothetical protein